MAAFLVSAVLGRVSPAALPSFAWFRAFIAGRVRRRLCRRQYGTHRQRSLILGLLIQLRRSHQDLVDPHTIHIHHLKRPTAPGNVLGGCRHVSHQGQDQAGEGVEVR